MSTPVYGELGKRGIRTEHKTKTIDAAKSKFCDSKINLFSCTANELRQKIDLVLRFYVSIDFFRLCSFEPATERQPHPHNGSNAWHACMWCERDDGAYRLLYFHTATRLQPREQSRGTATGRYTFYYIKQL